jgi:hypothetical protein
MGNFYEYRANAIGENDEKIKEALRKCGLKLENSNYFVLNFSLTYWNGLQKGLPHQKL